MGHDWVIHVLSDLRTFAERNQLPLLGERLDDAIVAASVEIAENATSKVHWPSGAARPQSDARGDQG